MDINTDVLDKETTYNPLLDGFKSDGSGIGRKDTQALSGELFSTLDVQLSCDRLSCQ